MNFLNWLLLVYWQNKPIRIIDKTLIFASGSVRSSCLKYERIKNLIDSGANPNVHDFRTTSIGETPLMHLCSSNFYKEDGDDGFRAIKFMLENGAEVNAKEAMSRNALFHAAISGDIRVIKLMIEWYRGNHLQLDDNKHLPLHYSILSNNLECVQYLKKITPMYFDCINPLAYCLDKLSLYEHSIDSEIKILLLLLQGKYLETTKIKEWKKVWVVDLVNYKLDYFAGVYLGGLYSESEREHNLKKVLYLKKIKECIKVKGYSFGDKSFDSWAEQQFLKAITANNKLYDSLSKKNESDLTYQSLAAVNIEI